MNFNRKPLVFVFLVICGNLHWLAFFFFWQSQLGLCHFFNICALYNTGCFFSPLGYQYHHPSKMSNSHPLRPYTAVGEIDHVHILSEHIGALMNGEEYSDVTFIVEKKRFPAHRVILAARCHYFR